MTASFDSIDSFLDGTTRPRSYSARPPTPWVEIGQRRVGDGYPVFVIAEIGINHNGSIEIAKELIEGAAAAGCDAVKFQKRTPELCVPRHQWDVERETPWGRMTYIEYRRKTEFGEREFAELDLQCKRSGIQWFASAWDIPSVDFLERFAPPCYKAASASLTDLPLLRAMKRTGRPLVLSTGMSTWQEITTAVETLGEDGLLVAHATSTYPCPVEELNLRVIPVLKQRLRCPIGYSGHELGLAPTWAAVSLGATFVERHITLDRRMWGSDHSASVELGELHTLVSKIRDLEAAFGDGEKRVYESERPFLEKLRRVRSVPAAE